MLELMDQSTIITHEGLNANYEKKAQDKLPFGNHL